MDRRGAFQRTMPTSATIQKRQELTDFIERELVPELAVQAVIGTGSIASGLARPDSDIDAIIFFDPLDLYVVPAESKWNPSDGSFNSIMEAAPEECMQFDFARFDLTQWADPSFEWSEERCSELREGWIAFDRFGKVAKLIEMRTTFTDQIRKVKLDKAITMLDQHLSKGRPESCWASLGAAIAQDRLQAAYEHLVQALFAYNRHWRPWRDREMSSLLTLPWLPEGFADCILGVLNSPSPDYTGHLVRVDNLRRLFQNLTGRLVDDGEYGIDIVGEAFVRSHQEPGRAWNMGEWNKKHGQRRV